MKMHLIAVHMDNKNNPVGFRILDSDSGEVNDYNYTQVYNVVKANKAKILGIELSDNSKSLRGSNGAFQRYTCIKSNGNNLGNSIVILYSIDNIGYRVSNFEGKMLDAYVEDVITYANKVGIANGKVVEKDIKFVSAITGNYDNIPVLKSTLKKEQKVTKTNSNQNSIKHKQINNVANTSDTKYVSKNRVAGVYVPKIILGNGVGESHAKDLDENTGMTVEQKLAYVVRALQQIKPFYYSIYRCINVVEAHPSQMDTMGVTVDTLYFNAEFVRKLPLSELLFTIIHEMLHIAMKHRIREKHRKHVVWNYACDYYVNKSIVDDFKLDQDGNNVLVSSVLKGSQLKFEISLPKWVLFNPNVNIDKDTPESIYEELSNIENQDEDNTQGEGNQGNGEQGEGSDGSQSSSGDQQSNNSNGQGSNYQGQESEESSEDNSNGDGNNSNSEQEGNEGNNNKQGSGQSNSNSKEGKCIGKENKLAGKSFRGKEIKDIECDIADDEKSSSESAETMEQRGDSLVRRIVTVHKQSNSFGGDNADWIERYIEKELAPKIDWRSLLKSKLNRMTQRVNTFSAPDKRFRSRGMIMPGPKTLEADALENVKICVDTSGSITPKDLGIALAQVEQLLNTCKAKAELLYWDTRIRAVYPFEKIDEIVTKQPLGGGGTDANCIFDYFETNRDYKIGRKAKPSVIVVFTDGYFGELESKYKKYRDVIWVVAGNSKFIAPFGVVAPFKIDN